MLQLDPVVARAQPRLVDFVVFLIRSSSKEFISLAKVVLRDLDQETNIGVTADYFERRLVIVWYRGRVAIEIRSAFLNGYWPTHDAKVVVNCLTISKSDNPDRGMT